MLINACDTARALPAAVCSPITLDKFPKASPTALALSISVSFSASLVKASVFKKSVVCFLDSITPALNIFSASITKGIASFAEFIRNSFISF